MAPLTTTQTIQQRILTTRPTLAPAALRLLLALVIFPHGAQKLLGWYGGFGFTGTMSYFTQTVHLPWFVGFLVILIEFFGPILLLLGYATRPTALAIGIVMAGIIVTTNSTYFFMNWFGNQKSEGFEFFLLTIGMSASLLISGGGTYSLDRRISQLK